MLCVTVHWVDREIVIKEVRVKCKRRFCLSMINVGVWNFNIKCVINKSAYLNFLIALKCCVSWRWSNKTIMSTARRCDPITVIFSHVSTCENFLTVRIKRISMTFLKHEELLKFLTSSIKTRSLRDLEFFFGYMMLRRYFPKRT